MIADFHQFKDYPKVSGVYTRDDIRRYLSTIVFQDEHKTYSTDDIMQDLHATNNYCDYGKISVDCFSLFWTLSECEVKLTQLATKNHEHVVDGEIQFPVLNKINAIAKVLCVADDPFDDYEEYFYFDANGLLKVARTLRLVNPFDENDDGIEIILYDGMNEDVYDDVIHNFFYEVYIKYMSDLPNELRKPITKMNEDELKVFLMYVI